MASKLKSCGDKILDSDIDYTLLSGLGPKYGSLVVTLTNMPTKDNPLELGKVTESILTEDLWLKGVLHEHSVSNKNINNPLAFKPHTSFKGSLSSALVARSQPQYPYPQYRYMACPYPYPYPSGRGALWTGSDAVRIAQARLAIVPHRKYRRLCCAGEKGRETKFFFVSPCLSNYVRLRVYIHNPAYRDTSPQSRTAISCAASVCAY